MKDPAFLFYYQDFLVGTSFMSNEVIGAYIKILCYQADKGSISKEHMLSICINKNVLDALLSKFVLDADGNYYNVRLRDEVEKRRKYAESRRKNAKPKEAYARHMEDGNEDINEDISNKREGRFYKLIPLKFQGNDEFWEAWKNWVDLNTSRGTDLLPKQAKEQLAYLETHPDPIGLLKQAFANGWKGIIYKEKENGNNRAGNRTGATADEVARICTDYIIETGQT